MLGYIRHPFIVGLRMAFQTREKLFFVLDYCAGGELFFHLGKLGKFPEVRARFYAAEITLALGYIHQFDIIYRDLKPEVTWTKFTRQNSTVTSSPRWHRQKPTVTSSPK